MIAATLVALVLSADAPTVSIPLSELKTFFAQPDAPPAPVSGAVFSQRLTGRITGDGVEVTANFIVSVLDGAAWTRLSLFKLTPGVTLVDAPRFDGALVAVHGGDVVLLSRTPGTYPLELKLAVRAVGSPLRVARLVRGADALDGVLKLDVDSELDELQHGVELASESSTWTVRWKTLTARKVAAIAARPPLEPVISAAHAQLVSTVEGRARLTMQYALELDREQPLTLRLPEGWTVSRVSLNGASQAVPTGREVTWTVGPARTGETKAALDVTLERDFGVFHLSGRLAVALPGASWPTARVEASVHLPEVFEYRRLGGSLEPSEELAWTAPSMPGRQLVYRQHLVAAAGPTLELAYSVDLNERYFSIRGMPVR